MKLNKVKKAILSIAIIAITVLGLGQTAIYASSGTLYAALDVYRYLPTYNSSTGQYTYNSTGWGFQIGAIGHKVYQINELNSADSTNAMVTGENSRIYCLNARVGNTWNYNTVGTAVTYNTCYDFKNEKSSILSELNTNTSEILTSDYYSAIIWLLDNFYITNVSDKESFLGNIGISKDEGENGNDYYFFVKSYDGNASFNYDYIQYGNPYKWGNGYSYKDRNGNYVDVLLPDELIETVQQSVLWYFTNYLDYDKESVFNCYIENDEIPLWLYYTENGSDYSSLSSYDADNYIGAIYQEQAAILYNYLVDSALAANTAGYAGSQTTSSLSLNKTNAKITKNEGENTYEIGPFTVETTGTVSGLSIASTVGTISLSTEEIIKGKEFYITGISSTYEGNITLNASATGNSTTQTLWVSSEAEEQPIVKIERIETPLEDYATYQIKKDEPEKYFDLALRKTIFNVKNENGMIVSTLNEKGLDASRTINVNPSTIPNTATYKHRKDPVVVGTGYKVTYQLNIYNEGDIDGYPSIIVDQLPKGLESTLKVGNTVESKKGNVYKVTSYENNRLELKLITTSPTVISAYSTTLDKDTIQLECKVTQKEDTSKHYLTNIAYINEAKNANGQVQAQDRKNTESKPSIYPEYSANDLNNTDVTYQGNSTNQSIYNDTNNEYYYKGQEDDDDFETIVIPAKEFDLKLVKYISEINGDKSKGKTVTSINTTKLASGKNTTADYTLSKDVITVEKGDYVTYTFRVYNEGELNGYVTKLTDNIPLGLQFVQKSIDNDGKTITVYNYDEKDGLTSSNIEVDSTTYGLINSNNSYWTIDNQNGNVKVDTYDGDITPSISIDVADYLGGTNKLLNAYDSSKDENYNGAGLDYVDVTVVLKVSDTATINKVIRNEAAITGHTDEAGNSITDRDSQPENWYGKDNHNNYQDDEDYDNIKLVRFDLALRKFITAVSSDISINDGEYLTTDGTSASEYTRAPNVDTSKLKTGEDETAIYNHSKDAVQINPGDYILYTIRVYNEGELDGYASKIIDYLPEYLNYIDGEFNKSYGWEYNSNDKSVTTTYLSSVKGTSNKLKAFDRKNDDGKGSGLDYRELSILCRVSTDAIEKQNITNIAEITEYQDENGTIKDNDLDSDPANLNYPNNVPEYEGNRNGDNASNTYYPGQEDDDDFDRVIIIRGRYDVILIKQDENGEQLNSEATFEVNGETKTVIGTLIIADDVEINKDNISKKDTYIIKETKAPDEYCEFDGIINIDITKKQSSNKYEIDSVEYKVTDQNGNKFDTEDAKVYLRDGNIYVEVKNHKQDEKKFDLALRKFITNISGEDVKTRIPSVSVEDGKITYTHPKDVVKVVVGDVVTYTIRVYNEGEIAGYAQTVTDDIPEYLEYLPENEINVSYRWKMYDTEGKETDDVSKAEKIVTDYTSKEYGEELMKSDETLTENPNLLKAFDSTKEISDTNPQYVDVKVAFKVEDPNSSSYIIKNKAQISEDSDDDIDSIPNEWNEGEDDQDYENISVEYFDLSLLKYVTEVEVTENGTTTTTKTGNVGDENDIVPKVEIHRKKINSTTVKFIYTIKITNEGDIPGYATEITDYVPKGLEFIAEDNKGWEEKEDGVITTELLSDTLLKPGESATVKVTFRWINDDENLGVKTNIAEISDDYNEKEIPDRDSTPGNKKEGEDDIDDADVLLSIKTGITENIIAFISGTSIILLILAGGVTLIKKYVL